MTGSIPAIVTRGFGSWGNVNLVATRGYGTGAAVVVEPEAEAPVTAGGDWQPQWLPVKPKPKKRKPQPIRGTASVAFSSVASGRGLVVRGAAWHDEDELGAVAMM